jgi:hypothetical protein
LGDSLGNVAWGKTTAQAGAAPPQWGGMTLMRSGPFKLYLKSGSLREKNPHVYIGKSSEHYAKYALAPVALISNSGFEANDLRKAEKVVKDLEFALMQEWKPILEARE